MTALTMERSTDAGESPWENIVETVVNERALRRNRTEKMTSCSFICETNDARSAELEEMSGTGGETTDK
jgi:hypothetical protein